MVIRMIVENQMVKVTWLPNNMKYYIEKGYTYTKIREKFFVNVKDLTKSTSVDVEFICDICLEKGIVTKFHRNWKEINRSEKNVHRCNSCLTNRKHAYSEVKKYFEDNNCVLLDTEYVNDSTPLNYICECGNISKIRFSKFKMGQRCYDCRNIKISKTQRNDFSIIKKEFENIGAIMLSDSDEYKNKDSKLKIICHCGEEIRVKVDNYLKNKKCANCRTLNQSGEKNVNWNPNKSVEERLIQRSYTEYTLWRNEVFKKDKYTCQCCGDNSGGNLESHHLDGYDWCLSGRTDIENGITLCEICHNDFHWIFGYGSNTKEQFEEYMEGISWNCKGIYKDIQLVI